MTLCLSIDKLFNRQKPNYIWLNVYVVNELEFIWGLSMGTVAEGIETNAQAALLLGMGCLKGQGNLYSKPVEEHDYSVWANTES